MSGTGRLSAGIFSLRSLRHHWRVNLAVMLGVMVGTAVLTGAFAVGDSVRQSLRKLTLERLGLIDEIILADHFFSADLAVRMRLVDQPIDGFSHGVPIILMDQTTIQAATKDRSRRSGHVTLVGCDSDFWELSNNGTVPRTMPTNRQIVLNQPLADDLGAHVGDRVVVRLPKAIRIAGDSPLGEKTDRIQSLAEMEVVDVIPASGLGRFSLRANQALPRTAYVDTAILQQALHQRGQVNAILVSGPVADQGPNSDQIAALRRRVRPSLEDAGLRLKAVSLDYWPKESAEPRHEFQYVSLSTDTMMFSPAAQASIARSLSGLEFQTVLTYLANSISRSDDSGVDKVSIPYSTVTALNNNPKLTPLMTIEGESIGPVSRDQVVLNRWAAEELRAVIGDRIRISYFAPETTHGETTELTRDFELRAIAPLRKPSSPFGRNHAARFVEPPFRANDPDLTPQVPGITDQESIDAWDPPFPFDYRRIRKPQDEDYWDNYRTTPKAFVNRQAGEAIWGSRFGKVTSFRIAGGDDESIDEIRRRVTSRIAEEPESFGFVMLHVKQDGLRASQGTTPFNLLFMGFSFFIMAAAVMLVCLMFRLSLEQRADEAGLLLAVGLNLRQVAWVFLLEGGAIAVAGGVLGTILGIAYAGLMIVGLRTWWLDAVVTPFLQLHIKPTSLFFGGLIGATISLLTIVLTMLAYRKLSLQDLLTHNIEHSVSAAGRRRRMPTYLAGSLWIIALSSSLSAVFLHGEAQAGAFFASGASVLIAILLHVSSWLKRPVAATDPGQHGLTLPKMVIRNVGRNAGRSTLTLGLMAAACFLIVAISAFRVSPTSQGTGGFQLLGQSDVAIFDDLNNKNTRVDLLGHDADQLAETEIFALRSVHGDDASCRNLYQAQRPKILGVTPAFVQHFNESSGEGFSWAGSAASDAEQAANPWQLLIAGGSASIPVVLDKNTAMYSLHLYGGIGEEFDLDYGPNGTLTFRVVGLLANSVLQGSLLISEADLLRQFPAVSGYQFFLIQTGVSQPGAVGRILEEAYRDEGFQTTETRKLLADLLAIQNTYLSTFQSLGGLGLLLGTFGLVAVQLRNVFERRAELALLRATGFSESRLTKLVVLEHLTLLLGGLGIGVAAALIAVLPHAWTTEVRPPWVTLASILMTILLVGVVTGVLALRPTCRAPIMDALRCD